MHVYANGGHTTQIYHLMATDTLPRFMHTDAYQSWRDSSIVVADVKDAVHQVKSMDIAHSISGSLSQRFTKGSAVKDEESNGAA